MQWKTLTISEIDCEIVQLRHEFFLWIEAIKNIKGDPRKGVQKLFRRELKWWDKQDKEKRRHYYMMKAERELWSTGFKYVAGVDEVGRGPLAGPVVAAAVILPRGDNELGLTYDDSKRLSLQQRELAYEQILTHALAVNVGVVSPRIIDQVNILQATFLAMHQALQGLAVRPDIALVDGDQAIPNLAISQRPIVGGDAKVRTIAAASIVAKVYRDRLIARIGRSYPAYCFAQNKGYPTAKHRAVIAELGSAIVHRQSYLK